MRRGPFAGPMSTLGIALLLPLAGCGASKENEVTEAAAPASDGTLASVVTRAPGLAVVSAGLKWTGLANVFDGAAPYTLLAPDDDAFGALGRAGAELQQPENAAAMADILRDHILPGYVTVADIETALKASSGEAVRMKTMGDTEVSFSREGETIVVTAPDGARAKIDGSALTASNGVVIPVDAVLRKLPTG